MAILNNNSSGFNDTVASANIADNAVVTGDGGSKGLQGSVVTISDTGAISGVVSVSMLNKTLVMTRVSMLNAGLKNLYVDGNTGYGEIIIGDNEEYAQFRWTSTGVVSLTFATANISSVFDNAGTFNIYDNGTGVSFQNNLGSPKTASYHIYYSQE